MINRVFHNYRVEQELGRGGWATVYRGQDTKLDRPVAIKVLHPSYAVDPKRIARFRNEAKALARLRHDNIVLVHDYIEADPTTHLIVMEYVDGTTLAERLQDRGALPEAEALHLFRDMVHAVGYAHENGIIHRDVNPHNIMVTRDGMAKVTDFGISRMLGAERMTQAGMVLGTLHYMAPEQLERGQIDQRTDIYAMGATLYQMVTGRKPFQEFQHDKIVLMDQICEGTYPDPLGFVPTLSATTQGIIHRTMAHRPRRRFARTDDILASLDRAAARTGPTESQLLRRTTPGVGTSRFGRVAPWVLLAAVGAAAALASLLRPGRTRDLLSWAWPSAVVLGVAWVTVALVRGWAGRSAPTPLPDHDLPDQLRDRLDSIVRAGGTEATVSADAGPRDTARSPRIEAVAGKAQPREIVIADHQIATLGRSSRNALWLDEEVVSRTHAFIKRDGLDLVITDLHSMNGTHVNGQDIRRAALHAGDRIHLGGPSAALVVHWD